MLPSRVSTAKGQSFERAEISLEAFDCPASEKKLLQIKFLHLSFFVRHRTRILFCASLSPSGKQRFIASWLAI